MKNWYIYVGLIVVLIVVLVLLRGNGATKTTEQKVTRFDDFAQCLSDAGALFYGAYWCPHCKDQKEMFENSSKLPYVECSTVNRQQTQECTDAGITGYPTWVFVDGSRQEGTVPLESLAEKTGCVLPE
jgi:thiol-disulfide isomerase/thioredoxin